MTTKLMTVELTHEDGIDRGAWSTFGETTPAEAVDRLIRVLAETRKTMEPAFAEKLPMLVKEPPQVDAPAWQWSMEADGSLILNLRHPGWVGSASGCATSTASAITWRMSSSSGTRSPTSSVRTAPMHSVAATLSQ